MSDPASRSTGELVRDIADDVRLLVRKELELARAELVEALGAKLKGAGLVAGAVLAAFPGAVFLVVALALWIPPSDAVGFAAVGAGLLALAGGATLLGVRLLRRPATRPRLAIESVKEDVRWAREQLTR